MDVQTTLKRNPELLAVDMDGETVMMDMESGNYFGVNSVGSHIWEALEDENHVAAIIETVNSQFEVGTEDTVQDDVLAFLSDMVEQKLVEVVSP
ncbi:PqqD family peptide modification chaperone [Leucothrix pacifica]|uniref:PqqD family protein n=1 Tax=Leucothrix pacifica TaxID=1247513 RepID=A0A317C1S3_9GAMM|nr:PqqD family peptide modification chaperone [Leucothrix pacifica]PWQ92596.1 PqqD family protein [Leucothrix pacifica]